MVLREPSHFSYDEQPPTPPPISPVDYPLPDFTNPVSPRGVKYTGSERHVYTTIYDHLITMEDGTRYKARVADVPDWRQHAASDVANLETTAWTTQPDGLYEEDMRDLAERSRRPSIVVGVQQNVTRLGNINHTIHDLTEIHKTLADIYDFDTDHMTMTGRSRGTMNALGTMAIAREHATDVVYGDLTVPVRLDGIRPIEDAVQIVRSIPHELLAVASLARERGLYGLLQLRHTINPCPHEVFQQSKEALTLLSGDIGKVIDKKLDPQTFAYLTAYEGDIFTAGSTLGRRFNHMRYPNIILDTSDSGGHLSCTLKPDQQGRQERLHTVSELLHEGHRDIGAAALRSLAAERNPAFRR